MKETFKDYKKKYNFNKYEQTSCVIYEMYLRAEKIKDKTFNTSDEFSIFSDFPRVKDIYLYSSNDKVVTLQNIIYNVYPDIYIDAIIWIIQYRIMEQLNLIKQNLNKIENQQRIIKIIDTSIQRINPYLKKLNSKDEYFTQKTINLLLKFKNLTYKKRKGLEKKYLKKCEENFQRNEKDNIIKFIDKIDPYSYEGLKKLSKELNEKLEKKEITGELNDMQTNLNSIIISLDNIIEYIVSLKKELKIHFSDDVSYREINASGFNTIVKNHLKQFSFTLDYLKKEYLENDKKQFNIQIIENPYDGSYIQITKTYVIELIDKYLLNYRIAPNFKRPIHELQHISSLTTLHNINLSLPIDELTDYIIELKKNYYSNLKINEDDKYDIELYNNKKANTFLKNLDDCIRLLYIYDKCPKNEEVLKICEELDIGRSKYYELKKVADVYINEKKYKELFYL